MDNKKTIAVFGATGKTGQHAWRQALEQGHEVTVFVRSVAKIESVESDLHIVQGDVFDADSVAKAVANHDAAIICLGSTNLRDKTTLTIGTKNVIDGMVRHNVGRLVILSAAGVGKSWAQISWLPRILFKTMLRNVFADHHTQEALVKESPLDWTIVRAAVLKDEPASGDYTVSRTNNPFFVAHPPSQVTVSGERVAPRLVHTNCYPSGFKNWLRLQCLFGIEGNLAGPQSCE